MNLNKTKPIVSSTGFLCEIAKLKSQQKYLEATQSPLEFKGLSDKEKFIVSEAIDVKSQLDTTFMTYKDQRKIDLSELANCIKDFKDRMMTIDGIHKFNTKEYRDQIIYIDQTFRQMLTDNITELNKLKTEFTAIQDSLSPSTAAMLHDCQKMVPSSMYYATSMAIMKHAAAKPIQKCDNDDCKNFFDFLRIHHGHSGSWLDEEHYLFVKIKNKYRDNLDRIILAVRDVLSGLFKF